MPTDSGPSSELPHWLGALTGAEALAPGEPSEDAVIGLDDDGRVVDLNPAGERLLGRPESDVLGRSLSDLIGPADAAEPPAPGPAVLGRPVAAAVLAPDGGTTPVEMTIARWGAPRTGYVAWVRDVSREHDQRAAWVQQMLSGRAEPLAGVGHWNLDLITDEMSWSDHLFRLYGLDPNGAAPALDDGNAHPDDRRHVRLALQRAMREAEPRSVDYRIIRPDHRVRHLRTTMALVNGPDGRPRRLVGSAQDITEQRRAERELAARFAVSEGLAGWADEVGAGMEALLRTLGETLDFAVGAMWAVDGSVLQLRSFWHADEFDTDELQSISRALRPHGGEDLPGRAMASHEPVSIALRGEDSAFPRRDAALRIGLTGAVAVPLQWSGELLAVLELFATDGVELTDGLHRCLTGISHEVGHFLVHRRVELTPHKLTARELQVLQLAAQGYSGPQIAEELVVSPATVKTHFENIYVKWGVSDRVSAVAKAMRDGLIE